MQYVSGQQSHIVLCIDYSIYTSYEIGDLNFATEFRLKFSVSFLT